MNAYHGEFFLHSFDYVAVFAVAVAVVAAAAAARCFAFDLEILVDHGTLCDQNLNSQ